MKYNININIKNKYKNKNKYKTKYKNKYKNKIIKEIVFGIIPGIKNEIIPKKCSFCSENNERYLCKLCYMKYLKNTKISKGIIKYNVNDENNENNLSNEEKNDVIKIPHIYFGSYAELKKYIYLAKYNGELHYIKGIIHYLISFSGDIIKEELHDVYYCIYVPSNFRKILKRGNCITKYIFKNVKKAYEKKYNVKLNIRYLKLFKEKNGIDMKNLNRRERKEQIHKKFIINQNVIEIEKNILEKNKLRENIFDKKILIVDDVISSKTTINYIINKLLKIGFKNICVISLANNAINIE